MNIYFLISPQPELLRRAELLNASDELKELVQSRLWSAEKPDRGILNNSDYQLLVELLFLDSIDREYSGLSGFDQLFPGFIKSKQFFNSLWQAQRIELDNSVEFALEEMAGAERSAPIDVGDNERITRYLGDFLAGRIARQ